MNVPSSRVLLPALLVGFVGLAGLVPIARGGWGIVTVDDFPDHFVVGEPTELAFTARAHGITPIGPGAGVGSQHFQFSIIATDGKNGIVHGTVSAEAGPGRYRALLTLPHSGDWKIAIGGSGLAWPNGALPPTRAVEAGDGPAPAPAPDPLSAAERGLRLFVAKGCVGCHVHEAALGMGQSLPVGPVLTGRHFPEAYLASFLADPASVPSPARRPGLWQMPNLGLRPHEISALVAFLNAGS